MDRLENVIQPYAWGSRTAIAALQGRPTPTSQPEAELWMGAHPSAPSKLPNGATLLSVIEARPEQVLGARVARSFGPKLPFLLKVLAAETPLSLQAHPSLEQAREGFERENARGVPLTAPHRNYKDANHKPELLCALEPFEALCGFREPAQTVTLLEALSVPELEPVIAPLRRGELRAAFERLMTLPADERTSLVGKVVDACERGGAFADEKRWAVELGKLYPGDAGVIGSLLLNLVRLEAGEAIYLPAGNLHAYLRGTGVELMANSDNVLRGGCTPKHVDVPELMRVLDFRAAPVTVLRGDERSDGERVYETPAPEFQLSRVDVGAGDFEARCEGPELLLVSQGSVTVTSGGRELRLARGDSAFLGAEDGAYRISGPGTVYRATVGASDQAGVGNV